MYLYLFSPTNFVKLAFTSWSVWRFTTRTRFSYRVSSQRRLQLPKQPLTMPKAKTIQSYYAVARGRVPGVYESWYVQCCNVPVHYLSFHSRGECETHVKGFAGASYKKFKSSAEAEAFAYGKSPKVSSSTTQPVASSSTHRMKPYTQHRLSIPTSTKGKQRALESSTLDRSGWLTVYSDGACKGNGKANSVAGVGVWWGAGDPR